jgi:hypothetical protein
MSDDRVLSCLDRPETSRVDCPTKSVHEFFDRTGMFPLKHVIASHAPAVSYAPPPVP